MTDQITEFVNSLPDEAIEAGVRAIEDEVIGDQMICFPEHVKSIIEAVLRTSHKAGHRADLPQAHNSSCCPRLFEDRAL